MAVMQGFTSSFFRAEFSETNEQIKVQNFEKLDVLHHLLAGFKAYYSEEIMLGVEKCRRLTGGAGYASFSGFTEIMEMVSPIPTYEGDNTVMMLQAARYVFKLSKKARKEKKLPYPFDYISKTEFLFGVKGKGTTVEEMLDEKIIEEAMAVRSLF